MKPLLIIIAMVFAITSTSAQSVPGTITTVSDSLYIKGMGYRTSIQAPTEPIFVVYGIQDTSNGRHGISRPLEPDPLRRIDSIRCTSGFVAYAVITLLKRKECDFVAIKELK